MRSLIHAAFIGLLLTLPLRLPAAEDDAAETPPWYQFEVIIFQRINPDAGSTEAWPSDPKTPPLLDVIPFDTKGSQTLRNNLPIPYRPLPADQQSLGDIWSRMRGSRYYRPLYHVAWRQQVVDPDEAQKLYISLPPADGGTPGPDDPPLLEGYLKIGVKRYLHVDVDLTLRQQVADAAADQTSGFLSAPRFKAYRMHEQSRMRSGKLQYLDHPVLGVLVQAEKYALPEPPPPPEPAPAPPLQPATPDTAPATGQPAGQTPPSTDGKNN